MAVRKLTEALVKSLLLPAKGQQFVYDKSLKGFGLRLSKETKCFIAERRLNGKTRRITIGPYPQLSVEKARKAAHVTIGELVQGIDRAAEREKAAAKAVSLGEAYKVFKQARKDLKENTIGNYDYSINRLLGDWINKPWIDITPMMVMKRHAEIGKKSPVMANSVMRTLSAVINFAMTYWADEAGNPPIPICPTTILSRAKAWFPETPRSRIVKVGQLAPWWSAVQGLDDEVVRDFLITVLLTGLRRTEAAALPLANVDFEQRTITVSLTKNGKTHVLPIPNHLYVVLKRRTEKAVNQYVFPSDDRLSHINTFSRYIDAVVKRSGVPFSCHDLRRTFATIADSLEISANAVKRLLNHSTAGDVTLTHYVHMDVERLRTPMQRIEDFILKSAGVVPSAQVVPLAGIEGQAVA